MIEKRKMERFCLQLPSHISVRDEGQEAMDLFTTNICGGGAFFETPHALPAGAEVDMEVMLPLDKTRQTQGVKTSIRVLGSVIRSDEKGMAICFDKKYTISPLP
ncbi:MAG: PilZ domain-containing protein [Pseudomonadota bacterium]